MHQNSFMIIKLFIEWLALMTQITHFSASFCAPAYQQFNNLSRHHFPVSISQ